MRILEVKDLGVAFNDISVLEQITFDVEEGDNFAIIGPNGSGKTVLFRALLDTVKYTGQIKWAPGTRIGYVPQRLVLDKTLPLTIREFLMMKVDISGEKKEKAEKSIDEAVRLAKLDPKHLGDPIGKVSGGQLQRAMISFALLGNPNVLLFDEPTASVDAPSEEQIYETLHELQDKKDMTIIVISHDLSLVNRYSNKVLCLNKRQICLGEPTEILTHDNLHKLYGGPTKFYHHTHKDH